MNGFSRLKFDLYSQTQLAQWLKTLRLNLAEPKQLAAKVLSLSNLYNAQKGSLEIWQNPDFIGAYLVYFLPLNYMRAKQVIADSMVVGFWRGINHIVDFGAGLGAFEWALRQRVPEAAISSFEPALGGLNWYQQLQKTQPWDGVKVKRINQLSAHDIPDSSHSVMAFSYSLNEIGELPALAYDCEGVAIIEPSSQERGRELMQVRQKLIDAGFAVWAPCLHQKPCPLLTRSQKDWCHNRIHIDMPDWFIDIERYLPMKNASITYSYLLARKIRPAEYDTQHFRIIGDTLFERGKTKQAVCQSEKRQFFSWLNKNQEAPQLPRGTIVQINSDLTEKGDELRSPDSGFQYKIKSE